MNSAVAGIVGIMVLLAPLLAAVTAIVTGLMARKQIARSEGSLTGKGMATTGIVLGSVSLLGATVLTTLIVVLAQRTVADARALQAEADAAAAGDYDVIDEDPGFEEEDE